METNPRQSSVPAGGRLWRDILRRLMRTTAWGYVCIGVALSALSVVTLFSAARHGGLQLQGFLGDYKPALTQLFALAVGVLGMLVLSLVPHRRVMELWWAHALCWGLVLLTFVPGVGYEPAGTGSHSWIALPLGMSLQPTELAKVSFIVCFARHLERVRPALHRPGPLAGVLLHWAACAGLVHLQGDAGTALVFWGIGGIMLLAAGLNRWVVAACAVAAAGGLPLVWRFVMSGYQKERVIGLFHPGPYADTIMYQQLQGHAAISGGGLLGIGPFAEGHQYVPRAENDFIFSYYAECFGFVGCLVLMGLLFALMFKTLHSAAHAQDAAGSLICVGVFGVLLCQTVMNLGMNLMLLPVIGVTLPFMSAGGSSMLSMFLCLGLVMGVDRSRLTAHAPRPTFLAPAHTEPQLLRGD